jgi:ATP-dependent protease ClpP protease subunit
MPKQNRYQVQALADGQATIYIYGDIGYDFWAEESNDAKSFIDKLNNIQADEITVRINSVGGSAADAMAIFNALRRNPANIITANDGVAMSAASLIFMAGDVRQAAANSMTMIHAPLIGTLGNAEEHRQRADMLDKYADAMISSYARSGMDEAEVESLLKDGVDHFYTADEALSAGFATEVTDAVEIAASGLTLDRFQPPAAWVAANHLNREETTMPKQHENTATTNQAAAEPVTEPVQAAAQPAAEPAAQTAEQVLAAEQTRRTDVRAVFAPFKEREGVQALLDNALDNPKVTVDAAQKSLLTHLGNTSESLAGDPRIEVGATEGDKYVQAAADAILARTGHGNRDRSNPFTGSSMMDIARASLDIAGVNHRGMDKREVVGAAFTHSTSDFPILLENVMHKSLLAAYAAAPDTWTLFCRVGNLSDFRAHGRYRVGSFGNLDGKTENNEFKHKTISDAVKETNTLTTKGNLIGISREMIINDDLGGFMDLVNSMGRAAKRTVEADVYALLAANPAMSDTNALFHASHGNLAGSGAAVSATTLSAARNAMQSQTDISGNDYLDIQPAIFVGGLAARDAAAAVNAMEFDDESNKNQRKPNITRGMFREVVGSPRISGNEWYVFADPMDAPVIEVGFLDGNQDPYLEMKEGFTQDGVLYKVRLDYGVAAIGYEGGYKNPGA